MPRSPILRTSRRPFRARGDGGRADRRIPRDIDQAGNHPRGPAAASGRSRSLPKEGGESASPIRKSATRFRAFALTAPIGNLSSSCPRSGTGSRRARASPVLRSSLRFGAATVTASSRAARSSAQTIRIGNVCRRRLSRRAIILRHFWRCGTSSRGACRSAGLCRGLCQRIVGAVVEGRSRDARRLSQGCPLTDALVQSTKAGSMRLEDKVAIVAGNPRHRRHRGVSGFVRQQ